MTNFRRTFCFISFCQHVPIFRVTGMTSLVEPTVPKLLDMVATMVLLLYLLFVGLLLLLIHLLLLYLPRMWGSLWYPPPMR